MKDSKEFITHIKTTFLKVNRWKVAFFGLVIMVLGTTTFLFVRMTQTREYGVKEAPPIVERAGSPVVTIRSNKQQVNDLTRFYLKDFQKDTTVKYEFTIQNEALLSGEFKVLGFPIKFYLYFDPYVMDNGNIQLKARSMSIGTLGVPMQEVMKTFKRNAKLPNWVEIEPDAELVMIRLDQFRMQNGLFLKATKIDLAEDDIQASLYLPQN